MVVSVKSYCSPKSSSIPLVIRRVTTSLSPHPIMWLSIPKSGVCSSILKKTPISLLKITPPHLIAACSKGGDTSPALDLDMDLDLDNIIVDLKRACEVVLDPVPEDLFHTMSIKYSCKLDSYPEIKFFEDEGLVSNVDDRAEGIKNVSEDLEALNSPKASRAAHLIKTISRKIRDVKSLCQVNLRDYYQLKHLTAYKKMGLLNASLRHVLLSDADPLNKPASRMTVNDLIREWPIGGIEANHFGLQECDSFLFDLENIYGDNIQNQMMLRFFIIPLFDKCVASLITYLVRKYKLDEALELLKGQDGNSAAMLLQSQILFKSGKMDASLDIYQKLQKSEIESLEINLVAGMVSAGKSSKVQGTLGALGVNATKSFELAYNTACSFIQMRKYSDAEQLLLSARRIGQEALIEDKYTDDYVEFELSPIAVQLAYVQQLLGQTQEDIGAYTGILKRNFADKTSLAVSTNNIVSAKGSKGISDSLKKLDRWIEKNSGLHSFQLAHELDWKLSLNQKEAIYCNRALLLLHSNKIDQARELVAALPDMFLGSVMPVLLQAAVFVKKNKVAKAEEILGQYSDKFPDKSKVVLLARAEIASSAGHLQVAADSLLKIPDIQHMPATVSTLISLKERSNDIDGVISIFDSAIKWWSNSMTGNDKLNLIMQEAASFKLKHGKKEASAELYEQLVKSHGSIEALVGLIKTSAYSDIEKAESYEKKLKPLPGLKSVDVWIVWKKPPELSMSK